MADLTRVNKQFSVLYGKEDDILASKNKIRDKFDLGDIPFSQYADNITAGSGSGSAEYFKCVAVGEKVEEGGSGGSASSGNSTDIIVSGIDGSVIEYFTELNQEYYQYNADATGDTRIWISKNTFYAGNGGTCYGKIYKYDGSGDWRLVIVNDPGANSYHARVALLSGSNADPIGTWNDWDDYNGNPAKTEWASAEPEIPPNTWNGQKAILLTDAETGKPYYEFEKTVTEGLPFGNGFTPVVDEIYDREALVKVSALVEKQGLGTVVAAVPTSGEATLNIYIESDSDGEIDWGDGSKTAITEGTMTADHTYTTYKEYTVTINGEKVRRLCFRDPQYGNWTSRCVKRLIRLGDSLTSMYKMFNEANGSLERIEDTCQIPEGVTNMELAFRGVYSLTYAPASLRLPNGCSTFERAFYQCTGLEANATNWFDNFTEGGKNMVEAFQQTKITGTVPASKLWNSGWSWNGTAYCFSSCSNLSNYNDIPSNWK